MKKQKNYLSPEQLKQLNETGRTFLTPEQLAIFNKKSQKNSVNKK